MLVLSRQRDETIMIGDDIEITIVDIRGDKVRLGITAPNRIAVHRKEVYESITRENRQAAAIAGSDLGPMSGGPSGSGRHGEGAPLRGLNRLSPIAVSSGASLSGPLTSVPPSSGPSVSSPTASVARSLAGPPGSGGRAARSA